LGLWAESHFIKIKAALRGGLFHLILDFKTSSAKAAWVGVFQAKNLKLGKDVAIKVLSEEFARDSD